MLAEHGVGSNASPAQPSALEIRAEQSCFADSDRATTCAASCKANGRTATVSIESMDFLSPVRVGSMVNIFTEMRETGRSSMKIDVEVWCRFPQENDQHELQKVTEARFVMVALDDKGRIRAVKP